MDNKMNYCVMVKGACRGKACDFWVRVRIRKATVQSLAREMRKSITVSNDDCGSDIVEAFKTYWEEFGVTNMDRLCEEEPDLCKKIQRVNKQVHSQII